MKERPQLGTFSVSLAVKDIATSRAFYEALGFEEIAGDGKGWLILANHEEKTWGIGLFQGMFDENLLTFNPKDARAIEGIVRDAGYDIVTPTEGESGPAHFVTKDPDGNTVLVDQHE